MTELITGAKGSAHVTSAQQGAVNAYTLGTGAYILSGCAATLPSANTLHIAAGHLMVQGRAVQVSATDLAIANGTQGTKRNDLACLSYSSSGSPVVETAQLAVVQGTPSSNPVDPTVTGSILNGDTAAQIPLWRVSLDGITPTVATVAANFAYGPIDLVHSSADMIVSMYVRHNVATLHARWTANTEAWSDYTIATVPSVFVPLMTVSQETSMFNKTSAASTKVEVQTDGTVHLANMGGAPQQQVVEATLTWGV